MHEDPSIRPPVSTMRCRQRKPKALRGAGGKSSTMRWRFAP